MSSIDSIKELEASIQRASQHVELGKALERLYNNKDFKLVIKDGYFRDEAVRLVHLKSDPSMENPVSQESIIKQMDAIGSLSQYFAVLNMQARGGSRSIEADEQTLDEIQSEGGN